MGVPRPPTGCHDFRKIARKRHRKSPPWGECLMRGAQILLDSRQRRPGARCCCWAMVDDSGKVLVDSPTKCPWSMNRRMSPQRRTPLWAAALGVGDGERLGGRPLDRGATATNGAARVGVEHGGARPNKERCGCQQRAGSLAPAGTLQCEGRWDRRKAVPATFRHPVGARGERLRVHRGRL